MNTDCIFCKVIAGTVPSTKILETDSILVVKDIAPKAPYHYLIMPKKHLQDLRDLTHDDYALAAEMLMVTKKLAQEFHDNLKNEMWRIVQMGEKPKYLWQDAAMRWMKEMDHKRTIKEDKRFLRWFHDHLYNKRLVDIDKVLINQLFL